MSDCLSASKVLLASAGTGKTYALTNRFIELAANGVPLQDILATTFTRKAAGEILDRILGRLSAAALDDIKFEELKKPLDVPAAWSRDDAQQLLRDMLSNLHRFEVRTLDAWFQQILNVVALELGLPPGWTIGDRFDLDELRAQAILEVIADLDPHQADDLLRDLQQAEFKRSVFDGLLDLLGKAHAMHLSGGRRPEVWQVLSESKAPSTDELIEIEQALLALQAPKTGKGTPNQHWQKGIAGLQRDWQELNWKGVLGSSLMNAVLENKGKFSRIEIPGHVQGTLTKAAELAANSLLVDLHNSNLALCELVESFSQRLSHLKRQTGFFDFDDIPRLLSDPSQDRIAQHRLGRRVKHLLLDEFQDTSVLQWQVLEPMIEKITRPEEEEASLLCVGDVKQAIYAWREGESDLLAGINGWYDIPFKPLWENWRSSQKILEAVNVVFGDLQSGAPVIAENACDTTLEGIKDWANQFPRHQAAKDIPGSAWLLQSQAEKRKGSTPDVMRLVISRVQALHEQAPSASIGILVRRKREIQTLLLELKRLGIRASGEGGNLLTDSEAVQLALSMFRLADYPGDSTAFFHLATSPLGPFLEAHFDVSEGASFGAQKLSRYLRRRLLDDGCGQFLVDVAEVMERQQLFDVWNRHRFGQLVALGLKFEKRNELRISRFVDLIEEHQVNDPLAAPVRIMTVHASKGLEFDAVIMPFFDSRNNSRNALLARRLDPRRGYDFISLTPNKSLLPFSTDLKVMDGLRIQRDVREEMCVLYVAMTRARQRLEIILPPPVKKSSVFRTENLLRSTMRDEFIEPFEIPNAEVLWHNATQVDFEFSASELESSAPGKSPLPARLELQASCGKRALPRWSPSSTEGDGIVGGASLLSSNASSARARGTAIHRLFEEVAWIDDFRGNDQHLLRLLGECGFTGGAAMDMIASFRDALDSPAVRELLKKPEGVDVDLWRELPFAIAALDEHGADSILTGIFDRVVIRKSEGKITSATIIDFKTGPVAGELDLASKVDFYRGQMRAYRKALCARTELAPEQVGCKLLFVDAGLVADV